MMVSSIMTQNVIVASKSSKFSQLIEFFTEHNIRHLPVTNGDELIGIISQKDMLRYLGMKLRNGAAFNMASLDANFDIADVITLNPVTVKPDDNLELVFSILAEGKFQAVPVVKDGMVHGIISNKDLMKLFPEAIRD